MPMRIRFPFNFDEGIAFMLVFAFVAMVAAYAMQAGVQR